MIEPNQTIQPADNIRTEPVVFNRIRRWYGRYERYLIPGALLAGVMADALLFQNINLTLAFSILTWHLFLSGLTIAFIQGYDAGQWLSGRRGLKYVRLFAPLVLQYTFGALLSGFLIFYWFSSAFTASWPFVGLIIILMVSNDLLKKYYLWFNIQIGVYFFIVFSYSVLILPFLLRNIAVWVFLLAGFISLLLIGLYLAGLAKLTPLVYDRRRLLVGIIGSIFLVINLMYFAGIIPPVPLSVREAGVYHSVSRTADGHYRILTVDRPWWRQMAIRPEIKIATGQPVYVWAAIFAPTRLDTVVVHHWQYYDTTVGRWQSRARVPYQIIGGRDGGYRGYSFITNPTAGRWRVSIETARGQVIGRETFRLDIVDRPPELEVIWR